VGSGETVAGALERSGLGAVLARIPTWRGVLVLGYHRIGRPGHGVHDARLWSATQQDFDRQLRFLARHVQVVSGDELPAALEARRGRHVALTFDDGYRDNYELAYAVLRAHGLPAVFFLATGFLDRPHVAWWDEIAWMARVSPRAGLAPGGWLSAPLRFEEHGREAAIRALVGVYQGLPEARAEEFLDWLGEATGAGRADPTAASSTWMTWDMVREMRRGGMAFGAHTVDHPVLARCSTDRQQREIAGSVARVRDELGEPATLFSYPIGARDTFDERTRVSVRNAGITHAFSFYGGYQRHGRLDPLDIPRAYVSPTLSPARFRAGVTLPRVFCRAAKHAVADVPPPAVPEPEPLSPDPPSRTAGWGGTVRRGIIWSVAAFGASKALSLISILILARLLAPDEFGVVAAVAAYIALIELGSDLGMKPAIVYEQEEGMSERVQTAFTLNLLTAAALTGLGVLLAPAVADFFGVGGEAALFRLGALNLLLTGLGNVHDALLLRDMSLARRIRPQVARDVVRVAVSVGLALAGLGAAALVVGFLAGTAAWTAWQWLLTPLRPQLSYQGAIARSMIAYGAPAALLSVLATINSRLDVVLIGHLLDSRALGIYTIAYRLPEVLLASIAYTLGVVAFPALARRRADDPDALAPATMQLLRYMALYALPVATGLAVLSIPIVELLFSHTWHEAARVLVPIAAAAALYTVVFPLGDLLKAVGKQATIVKINVVLIPLMIAACVLAAPGGIVAVSWALVVTSATFAVMMSVAVARELRLRIGDVARTYAPAVAPSVGVLVGAGAVRLAWPAISFPALAAATIAGALGAMLALRLAAPRTFVDLVRQLRDLRPHARPAPARPA
jgi:O-antigen/teichoic acid export membrane protein/peptidoglycan/xylan/chitin deacetylase (PgdA/CDA1 family)